VRHRSDCTDKQLALSSSYPRYVVVEERSTFETNSASLLSFLPLTALPSPARGTRPVAHNVRSTLQYGPTTRPLSP
jgi:hypothetical protein